MEKARGRRVRSIYGVFLSVLTVLMGVLFIVEAWAIYRSAPQGAYTVERINEHFNKIAISVWIWLAAFFGNLLLAVTFPEDKKKRPKARVDVALAVERTKMRLPQEGGYYKQAALAMQKQVKFRRWVGLVCAILMGALFLFGALVLFGVAYVPFMKADFFAAHDGAADKLVQVSLLTAAALLIGCIAAGLLAGSRKREQKEYLRLLAEFKKSPNAYDTEEPTAVETEQVAPPEPNEAVRWEKVLRLIVGNSFFREEHTQAEIDEEIARALGELPEPPVRKKKVSSPKQKKEPKLKIKEKKPVKEHKGRVLFVRLALGVVGVVLVFMGIQNGGMEDVLLKAINICTQCIGLG